MLGSCNATFEEYPELALEIRGGLTRREVGQYGRQLVLPKLGPEGQREISRGQMEQAYTHAHTHTPAHVHLQIIKYSDITRFSSV